MTFEFFLVKYYSPPQHAEIISVLNNLCIYREIEFSINDLYCVANSKNKIEIISQLTFAIRDFVATIYMPLHSMKPGKQKARAEQKIAELAVNLIRDTYQLSGFGLSEYYNFFMLTIRKIYASYSWNFSVLEKLLNFDRTKAFDLEEKEKNNLNSIKLSKPVKLVWQGNRQLDLFIDDLIKTFKGIKCKKPVYFLFDEKKIDFKIELLSKHLLPFLTLFHHLHDYGAIKVIGNRGLFVYLHQHLHPPKNDSYPNRDFRKLRHEALQNENVKNNIYQIIKPLLYKYCTI